MAKGTNQKMKLIRLLEIMNAYTDENHGLTINEIRDKLLAYNITADRKSLYDDFESLRSLGLDIIGETCGRSHIYKLVGREFELAELKLLVDVIQASKFITAKKTKELISKIEKLCSVHEAGQLSRQVVVSGRIKTMNESIYYNVDLIHNAINSRKSITFLYYQWNLKKEYEPRRKGERYNVSPFALCWDNENYYLIAYDSDSGTIRHYRVDKMGSIIITNKERDGEDSFKEFDMAQYSNRSFGMFGGELKKVRLRLNNKLIGVILDRFGRDVIIIPDGEDHFFVNINAAISDQFFGWVFGLGEDVVITDPPEVAGLMKKKAEAVIQAYLP